MIDKLYLEKHGFVISDKVFNQNELHSLNNVASNILPFVGMCKKRGWLDHEDDKTKDVDWAYYWSVTPENNPFINKTILPLLANVCDDLLGRDNWGWQLTNRYIISNYQHDYPVYPHLDAPYLWPQMPDVQMAKYLAKGLLSVTFMIPLIEFTVENGATGFIPGSHNYIHDTTDWDQVASHRQTFFNDNYVQPTVPLGSFSCFYGNCMHSVMSNKTNTVRRAIIFRGIRNDGIKEMTRLGLG
jgi:hypothetical protein